MTNFWLLLSFIAGFLLVFGMNLFVADYFQHRREIVRRRLDDESRLQQRERARGSLARKELFELAAEGYVDLAAQDSILQRLDGMLSQAGIKARPVELAGLSLVLGTAVAALGFLLTGNLLVAGGLGFLGMFLPIFYVAFKRAQRRKKLLAQMPDAFELMGRVLRAGQTMSQAMRSVSEEFSRPIAEEFGYCWEQQNLGLSPDAVFHDLARRTGVLEMKIFVVALTIHRTTGGNLSTLLEKLAKVIRQRERIRGHIQALTAEGKFQAYILLVMPFALLAVIQFLNPDYARTLFEYPWLLVGMMVSEAIGAVWMWSIINFDF